MVRHATEADDPYEHVSALRRMAERVAGEDFRIDDPRWIGVDFDGTIAEYLGWRGRDGLGRPVPLMVARVKRWLKQGVAVKVMTARAVDPVACRAIQAWCKRHIGRVLEVTDRKDYQMLELWDDRAVGVVHNTGVRMDGKK